MDWTGYGDNYDGEMDEVKDLIISQSTIESMQLCPARVGLSGEPGFVKTVSEAMSFGTLVHALVEKVVTGAVTTADYTNQGIEQLWADLALEDGFDLHTVATGERIDASVDEARFALSSFAAWWNIEARAVDVLETEERKYKHLGTLPALPVGRQVWVGGTPDCVAARGAVTKLYDWKTAGRGWNEGKGLVRIQSPIYTWLALGDIEREVEFDYIVWNRRAGQWDRHPLRITPANVQAAKQTAWMWAKQIDAGAYPGTPGGESYGKYRRGWHCSARYCGAWEICPFKGLIPDNVDLEEGIVHGW